MVAAALGKLNEVWIRGLEDVIPPLQERIVKYKAKNIKSLEALDPTNQAMMHALTRLKYVATTFEEMLIGLRDVQRCWLEISALLDYMEEFRPRMDGKTDDLPPSTAKTIGAFIHTHREAQDFYRAGLPFWFLHPRSKVVAQELNILSLIDLLRPEEVLDTTDMPRAREIFVGPANDERKREKILRAARGLLSYDDPFASPKIHQSPNQSQPSSSALPPSLPVPISNPAPGNIPPPHAAGQGPPTPSSSRRSSSNSSSNTSRRSQPYDIVNRGKSQANEQPKNDFVVQRDRFMPVKHNFYPTPIFSWQKALQTVDSDTKLLVHHSKRNRDDSKYMFPDPCMFISTSPTRQAKYFAVWAAIRDACVYHVIANPTGVLPVSSQLWRDLLAMVNNFRREHLQGMFQSTFEHLGMKFDALVDLPPASLDNVVSLQQTLWDLHELNFHYEVIALDRRACRPDIVDGDDHRSRLLACFNVDPSTSPNPFAIVPSNGHIGLAAARPQDRLPLLLAFRNLFRDWECSLPPTVMQEPPTTQSRAENIISWEGTLARFYCQTFFNYFGRAPVIPYRRP
ncbi:hypothetical protein BDN72DRAFT_677801 [Pluteus cervinus]|uniref:Uncharacterized protein n=1 Tax=Pluteus cervinus TaxID=181527 RepID=A0ACD2ZZG4_9AGAR|nr:hypothetical protein BDN72DRAFT_677801 [Pluteus cervinus]